MTSDEEVRGQSGETGLESAKERALVLPADFTYSLFLIFEF